MCSIFLNVVYFFFFQNIRTILLFGRRRHVAIAVGRPGKITVRVRCSCSAWGLLWLVRNRIWRLIRSRILRRCVRNRILGRLIGDRILGWLIGDRILGWLIGDWVLRCGLEYCRVLWYVRFGGQVRWLVRGYRRVAIRLYHASGQITWLVRRHESARCGRRLWSLPSGWLNSTTAIRRNLSFFRLGGTLFGGRHCGHKDHDDKLYEHTKKSIKLHWQGGFYCGS